MVSSFLNKITRIARPIAASAAATVKTKNTKICPCKSPKKLEKAIKLIFTANNINSIAINKMIVF